MLAYIAIIIVLLSCNNSNNKINGESSSSSLELEVILTMLAATEGDNEGVHQASDESNEKGVNVMEIVWG